MPVPVKYLSSPSKQATALSSPTPPRVTSAAECWSRCLPATCRAGDRAGLRRVIGSCPCTNTAPGFFYALFVLMLEYSRGIDEWEANVFRFEEDKQRGGRTAVDTPARAPMDRKNSG
jgi:hypothetical protein